MRRSLLAAAAVALAVPSGAHGKEFVALAVVGSDGDSLLVRGPVADRVYAGAPAPRPDGGYLRLFPLGLNGFPALPGRWYPAAGVVCLSWNTVVQGTCLEAEADLRQALTPAGRLARFRGPPPTIRRLEPLYRGLDVNLRVALELAFARHELARAASRPRRCIGFRAVWRRDGGRRPRSFCLSPRGVFARGLLYPLGSAPYELAWTNPP